MPSVASDPSVLPPRPPAPSARNPGDSQASSDTTPFAKLLDSAAAPADPPPRPAASDPPNRPDRTDPPKRSDDTKAAAPSGSGKDKVQSADKAKAHDGAEDGKASAKDDAAPAETSADAKDDAKLIELKLGAAKLGAKAGADAKADADHDAKVDADKTDADKADALDALLATATAPAPAQTNAPAAVPQPVAAIITVPAAVAPASESVEADAIAALQAATQSTGAAKPVQTQGGAKETQPARGAAAGQQAQGASAADGKTQSASADDPQAKAATADPKAAIPAADTGKDGKPQAESDKPPAETHRTAETGAKLGPAALPQGQGDAASAVKASTDAVANLGVAGQGNQPTSPAQGAAAPAAAPGLIQAQAAAVPLSGLAVEIATQAHAGKTHFDIRLDPPDLGRIDVRLHVDSDGSVSTKMIADRSDTLDLLKRDASGLERALQQAGLKTSDNALQFSLRQQQSFVRDDTPMPGAAQLVVPDDNATPLDARHGYGRLLGLGGGLDIRV